MVFTLIELLIVIVVLGILAAVVIFALGGITGKSAVASCQADGATISTLWRPLMRRIRRFTNVPGTGFIAALAPPVSASGGGGFVTSTASYTMYYATGTAAGYSSTLSNLVGRWRWCSG